MKELWRTASRLSQHSQETEQTSSGLERTVSQNDPLASANQAAGLGWLAGHLNHLTPEQEAKLTAFKERCREKGYYTSGEDGAEPSHHDATLLQFLRARRFDVDTAFQQFKDTEEWRKTNAIEALFENIDVGSYDEARRMYPQWSGRRDRRGIPVFVYVVKHLNSKNMNEYTSKVSSSAPAETHRSSSVPPRLLRLFALYESLLHFVLPLCSALPRPNPETPIVSTTNIVDISGVGLRQFWNLKGHMQDASVLATAHYPETLDRIFIIGAPAFFPTVWGWIKRWFDPVTTSKIFILSPSEVKPTLTSFMDPSSIPKQYGGNLDWEWGDVPNLDGPARGLAGGLEIPPKGRGGKPDFVRGPLLFDGDKVRVLGTVDGKPRRLEIPVVTKEQQQEADLKSENEVEAAAASAVTAAPPMVTSSTLSKSLPYQNGGEKLVEANGAPLSSVAVTSITPADISE